MAAGSQFVDECGLNVRGGDGGAGCIAFRREAHVARGGPDGGDGGKGGDVWLVADRNVASLLAFRDHPHRRATNGAHGRGKRQHGAPGRRPLRGGAGGDRGRRTVTGPSWPTWCRRATVGWPPAAGGVGEATPASCRTGGGRRRFAEQGEEGEERWLRLELKLVADVALVGLPNVGKSTLISRISAAKPKIADYPFTTLEPNLGVVRDRRRVRAGRRRHPRPHRGRVRGQGAGPPLPPPRRAGPGPGRPVRPGRSAGADAGQPAAGAARRAAQLPAGAPGPAPPGDRLPRRPRGAARRRRPGRSVRGAPRRRRSPARACPSSSARWSASSREARQAEPVREAFVIHRPEPEGFARRA